MLCEPALKFVGKLLELNRRHKRLFGKSHTYSKFRPKILRMERMSSDSLNLVTISKSVIPFQWIS